MARRAIMSRSDRIVFWCILGVIVIIISIVSVYMVLKLSRNVISAAVEQKENIRILFVIHDNEHILTSGLSFYQPETGQLMLLSVPPHLGIKLQAGNRHTGIEHLFSPDAPEEYMKFLGQAVGSEITWYILLTPGETANLLDLLGGVNVTIMEDNPEDAYKLLLNGDTLERYIAEGKAIELIQEKVGHFDKLLNAIILKISQRSGYLLHRRVRRLFFSMLKSNFGQAAMQSYIDYLGNLRPDKVFQRSIHGVTRTVRVGNTEDELLFPYFDGQWLRRTVEELEESLHDEEGNMEQLFMQVELLNGTTLNGLAKRTQSMFEQYGFDIVNIGNAKSNDVDRTVIISHSENMSVALRIAEIIQCSNVTYEQNIRKQGVDATVILGNDFDGRYVR